MFTLKGTKFTKWVSALYFVSFVSFVFEKNGLYSTRFASRKIKYFITG